MGHRILDLVKGHPVVAVVAGLVFVAILLALFAGGMNRKSASPRRRRF